MQTKSKLFKAHIVYIMIKMQIIIRDMNIPSTGTYFTYYTGYPNAGALARMKHPVRFVDERRGPNPQWWKYGQFHDLDSFLAFQGRGLDLGKLEDVQWMDADPQFHPLGYADETRRLLAEARAPPIRSMQVEAQLGVQSLPTASAAGEYAHFDSVQNPRLAAMQSFNDRERRFEAARRRQQPQVLDDGGGVGGGGMETEVVDSQLSDMMGSLRVKRRLWSDPDGQGNQYKFRTGGA